MKKDPFRVFLSVAGGDAAGLFVRASPPIEAQPPKDPTSDPWKLDYYQPHGRKKQHGCGEKG